MTDRKITQYSPTQTPSALSAAISMGRFLARNPQFAQLTELHWYPKPCGDVLVTLPLGDPQAPELICAIGSALDVSPALSHYVSPATHEPMVSMTLRGCYEGTPWRVEVQVTKAAYTAFVTAHMVVAA